ncbi:lycopene beta and epsilon cyclase [Nitritalea halalkaliphila LW7]|uniref:Lycopene beta and epsilon cyclase n=2 Tax=Nitritalea TaxID=1187887 RepID=I5C995_9BACT|nr:lycopene beta and epsilon cyclase [Nitritalea halalkaliphila LW7]
MNVMLTEKEAGVDVFEQLYIKNSMQRLFRFLDEESALWEDILIMNSVPRKWPFVQAVLEEL